MDIENQKKLCYNLTYACSYFHRKMRGLYDISKNRKDKILVKAMKYKIAVFDIDGTLTNSKKEITKATYDAIMMLQQKGVIVVIASGRPTAGVLPIASKIHLEEYGGYILSFNGGKITNLKTKEVIYEQILPSGIITQIAAMADSCQCTTLIHIDDKVLTNHKDNEFAVLEARVNGLQLQEIKSFSDYASLPLNKCMVVEKGSYLAALEPDFVRAFGSQVNIFRSEPFFLEIVPQGVDKANCLSHLLKHLHIKREETAAFGDGFNDKTMIAYAGMGIAMGNAQSEVKAAADFVTKSNDEDGIAYAIEQLF